MSSSLKENLPEQSNVRSSLEAYIRMCSQMAFAGVEVDDVQREKLRQLRDKAASELYSLIPRSLETFSSAIFKNFNDWLEEVVSEGEWKGAFVRLKIKEKEVEQYGFSSLDALFEALDDLVKAWEGMIAVSILQKRHKLIIDFGPQYLAEDGAVFDHWFMRHQWRVIGFSDSLY